MRRLAGAFLGFFRTQPARPAVGSPEELARRFRRRRWITFIGATLGYAVFYTTRLNLSVAKKPMIDGGFATADELGQIGALLLLAYALGKVANGFLADRAHVGRIMGAGLVGAAVVNLAFGGGAPLALLAALWFVNGWCQSLGATPAIVNLSHWFDHRERGTRYSIWSSAHSIGEGITFVGTAALVSAHGWRWAFLGPGLLCLVVGVALFWVVHDRPEACGLPPVGAPTPAADLTVAAQQRLMLRDPRVWMLALAAALFYMARYGVNNWMILYLQEAKRYGLVEASGMLSLLTLAGLAGTVLLGPVSDLFFGARRGPLVTAYGILLVASLWAVQAIPPGHPWLDRGALLVCGYVVGGLLVVLGGLGVVDLAPKGASGAAVGLVGLCAYLGAALQDRVSGHLIERGKTVVDGVVHHDFGAVFVYWMGAAALATMAASVLWWVRPPVAGGASGARVKGRASR